MDITTLFGNSAIQGIALKTLRKALAKGEIKTAIIKFDPSQPEDRQLSFEFHKEGVTAVADSDLIKYAEMSDLILNLESELQELKNSDQ